MSWSPFRRVAALVVPPAIAVLACLGLAGCGRADASRTVVVTGSSTVAPLMAEIAARYEAAHPGVRIDVQTGGSSRGIADARAGVADLGMASRDLREDESELLAYAIARDGIGLIVHAENPVRELSREEVVGIFTGAIERWSDVEGADRPITVVHKAEGRSTLELFLEHFDLARTAVDADVVIGDNAQGIRTVAGNPDAIGYVSIGTAEVDAAAGVPIRLLPLHGVEASVARVADGSFPLSRPLHLVAATVPEGVVADLVDYARSEAVADLVRGQSFVPVALSDGQE